MQRTMENATVVDIEGELGEFRREFLANADPVRAGFEKAYLKSPHLHYGLTLPFIQRAARAFKKAHPALERATLHTLAGRLWAAPYHEEKTLAVELLELYPGHLTLEAMPMIESMLMESAGWAHLDAVAIHLAGGVLRTDPRARAYLRRWARDESFWMRRGALISQILLFRRGCGDIKLFFRMASAMINEKEFFIRKAIGWTLRELSKSEPQLVRDYIVDNIGCASGLTVREGSKRLPGPMRAEILEMLKTTKRRK